PWDWARGWRWRRPLRCSPRGSGPPAERLVSLPRAPARGHVQKWTPTAARARGGSEGAVTSTSISTRHGQEGAAVTQGRIVSMDYTVRLDDGRVVETTWGRGPVNYLHGGGQLLPALERALEGLAEGEQAEFVLAPEDAYGPRREENLATLPRSAFPGDVELRPGI